MNEHEVYEPVVVIKQSLAGMLFLLLHYSLIVIIPETWTSEEDFPSRYSV